VLRHGRPDAGRASQAQVTPICFVIVAVALLYIWWTCVNEV
jgi:hypothetical protein